MCSKGRRQPHVFFVLYGVSDSSWEGMSGLSPSGCLSAAALPAWPRWSRAVLWNQSSNMMLWSQLERQLWLWAEPSHSVRLGSLSAPRPSSLGCSSSAQHRAAQHYLLICRCGFFWDTVLATDFREFSRWMFQTSCTVSKSALSVKIHRHLLCLCWTVSLLHSSLQCNQKFWFQDKCHFWRNCGMEIPSCLCFHSSLMQNVYLLVSYYLQLCFASFYIPAWKYLRAHVTCIHMIGAKNWTCCWQAAHCHPNHQPPTPRPHPSSIIPPSALLFLGPRARLWPVDECYILAVSARVCWGLACGGSAVSGPVCQLLVPLPPGSQCWLGCSQWHKHTMTDSLWPENERITLRIGIFIEVPMKRRLFQTFKCSGVVFLNKPQKLWQMVYCISQYFISGTFNCHFQTSKEWLLSHSFACSHFYLPVRRIFSKCHGRYLHSELLYHHICAPKCDLVFESQYLIHGH